MYRIKLPLPAELVVEAEDAEAITRWLSSLTATHECMGECDYNLTMARGAVTAYFRFDPSRVKAETETRKPEQIEA